MTVVLLHALARTRHSMATLARDLEREGHRTIAIDHPSTRGTLPVLAAHVIDELARRGVPIDESTSFIGHSLGGLVYRALPLVRPAVRVGPSVTIGTPTTGSVVARALAAFSLPRRIYGPVLPTIAPEPIAELPPLPGPTLCIAGTRARPWVPAFWVLRAIGESRASDSTVLVDEALHPDAVAHATVDAAHTFLPSHPEVRRRIAEFLREQAR